MNDAGKLFGDEHPNAKYSDKQIAMLDRLKSLGYNGNQIARMTGMPRGYVYAILRGDRRHEITAYTKP